MWKIRNAILDTIFMMSAVEVEFVVVVIPYAVCVKNISLDTFVRTLQPGHNSRKATHPPHCGTCLRFLSREGFSPPFPSSTLKSNFVYPRQISRSPRVGHGMS